MRYPIKRTAFKLPVTISGETTIHGESFEFGSSDRTSENACRFDWATAISAIIQRHRLTNPILESSDAAPRRQ
jgi:hypothetical protein